MQSVTPYMLLNETVPDIVCEPLAAAVCTPPSEVTGASDGSTPLWLAPSAGPKSPTSMPAPGAGKAEPVASVNVTADPSARCWTW